MAAEDPLLEEDMILIIAMVQYRQNIIHAGGAVPRIETDRPAKIDKEAWDRFRKAAPVLADQMLEDAAAVLAALDRAGAIR